MSAKWDGGEEVGDLETVDPKLEIGKIENMRARMQNNDDDGDL